MTGNTFFGYRCPSCDTTVDIGASTSPSAEQRCPSCGTPMLPDPKGRASAANVYCPRCKIAVGLVNSDRCPECGGPWSRIP